MHVTFLLYEGIEPVDLAAIGVISMARRIIPELSYETVAARREPVQFSNGLMVVPARTFDEVKDVDVLLVPGGPGWRKASQDPAIQAFARRVAPGATLCSVCTGAMIFAEAGLLDGKLATTKVEVVPPEVSPLRELRERFPGVQAKHALLVDAGNVITGGGVTLCIDAVLYLLEKRFGEEAANEVARIMEYSAARSANRARLAVLA
ncbi:DJ-1/PfpI family protein [Hydrogenophaga sp.]|jgi:transcriptional regulator GlxA family with amidase domain|uniref:DJ-1/PfpI family protein n=1 Tax=Hydrogenophaga sp. TaxID=1904254 RepID=UPI003F729EE8